MNQLNIAVIFGGVSTEHEVSRVSAVTILEHLDPEKYHVEMIGITKTGRFLHYTGDTAAIASGDWEKGPVFDCTISCNRARQGIFLLGEHDWRFLPVDCVIPVLHGKNGEDGTIQGMLQLAGIPFVGCDTVSCANCMDKEITHILLEHAGIRMANWISVRRQEQTPDCYEAIEKQIAYPVFVKPANAGSSIGVSKANHRAELIAAMNLAFEHDNKLLVEEAIVGQEVECAVLGDRIDAKASATGEIESANVDLYDYDAKYVNPQSKLYIPARISEQTAKRLREIAVKAFYTMGCAGLSRVDFFVTEQNEILLNEINTFPGFTSISMYPKLWEYGGVPIGELLDRLIAYARKRS